MDFNILVRLVKHRNLKKIISPRDVSGGLGWRGMSWKLLANKHPRYQSSICGETIII